jgi:hypothetical protein
MLMAKADNKKGDTRPPLFSIHSLKIQGLSESSESNTMPRMMAAAATMATIVPFPPPSLFSFFAAVLTRFTDDETGLAFDSAACATAGAVIKASAEMTARVLLPKRI